MTSDAYSTPYGVVLTMSFLCYKHETPNGVKNK